jgi:hypothetical protein
MPISLKTARKHASAYYTHEGVKVVHEGITFEQRICEYVSLLLEYSIVKNQLSLSLKLNGRREDG